MPSVDFLDFTTSPPNFFVKSIEALATETITGWGSSVTYLVSGTTSYAFHGIGLTYAVTDGVRVITGGMITAMTVYFNQEETMELSGLSLDAAGLQAAISADASGSNDAALEQMFLPLRLDLYRQGWPRHPAGKRPFGGRRAVGPVRT